MDDSSLQGQIDGQVAVRILGATTLGALTALLVPISIFAGNGDALVQSASATYQVASSPVRTSQGAWCGRNTAITRDGRLLADVYPGITKEVIRVVDVESGEALKKINLPGDYSCNVLFSPDGKHLLITSIKVARIYDTRKWTYYDMQPN
jgi:hypothetical protein